MKTIKYIQTEYFPNATKIASPKQPFPIAQVNPPLTVMEYDIKPVARGHIAIKNTNKEIKLSSLEYWWYSKVRKLDDDAIIEHLEGISREWFKDNKPTFIRIP